MADSQAEATQAEDGNRVVAPVFVNGQGPFGFIVDTGANRSAASPALVAKLDLRLVGEETLHTIEGSAPAPFTEPVTLRFGSLSLATQSLPVIAQGVVGREAGLLGVEGLADRRLLIDFERRCVEIQPSRDARVLRGWASAKASLREDRLIYIVSEIDGVATNLILDTGSQRSFANTALRDALDLRFQRRSGQALDKIYTAGGPILLPGVVVIPRISLAADRFRINDVQAYVQDLHIFRLWGFGDQPAMVVGMDVLSAASAIAFDYGRSRVSFRLKPSR